MENVFFRPWIGKNYKQGYKGKKLLILGESHYCDGIQDENCPCGKVKKCLQLSECNDFTSVVLNRFFDYKKGIGEGERWMTTYTRFTNILLGEQVSNAELMEFWDNIVFYNYVQVPTKGPREKPASQDFANSKEAFFEILKEYKPDLIIVWGVRLRDNLPNNGLWADFEILNTPNEKFYYYEIDGKKIPAYAIYHPASSAFSYCYHEYLQEALRLS